MTENTPAAERAADDPPRELSPVEQLVANVVLHDRRIEHEHHQSGDDTDWVLQQVVAADAKTPRDVAAKLACAFHFLTANYQPEFPYDGHPPVIVASALVDLMLNTWAETREREKAEADEPAAAEDAAAAGGPVGRAFELLEEMNRRLRRLEAERAPEPAG